MDSRIREVRNRGISAASLSSEDVDENNLLKGAYSFVFGSPESLLQNQPRPQGSLLSCAGNIGTPGQARRILVPRGRDPFGQH